MECAEYFWLEYVYVCRYMTFFLHKNGVMEVCYVGSNMKPGAGGAGGWTEWEWMKWI